MMPVIEAGPAAQSVVAAPVAKGLSKEMVTSKIKTIAAELVGDGEALSQDTPLMESGMDSLSAVTFRNQLQDEFNLKLSAQIMFDYPSISDLSARLVELSLENR